MNDTTGNKIERESDTAQLLAEAFRELFSVGHVSAFFGATFAGSVAGLNAPFALAFGLTNLVLIWWLEDRRER